MDLDFLDDADLIPENWQSLLIACGSNAFGQITGDTNGIMMSSTFRHVKASKDASLNIKQLASGSNTSSIVLSGVDGDVLYLWGEGMPNAKIGIPQVIPLKTEIVSLSCGKCHAGFVTSLGKVYTWGSGEYGILGHGTRTSVTTPKKVETMNHLVASSISCGAYHTAIIACEPTKVHFVNHPFHVDDLDGISNRFATGDLYTCGLGKAGQLGHDRIPNTGASAGMIAKPTLVSFFDRENLRVMKVSCGFHHTLVVAIPVHAIRVFTSHVYACGWGEHGRLGLGHEHQSALPQQVVFPAPFKAVEICAGEQHSLASGKEGCYGWGNNELGQLGVYGTGAGEQVLSPVKLPLPEGMVVKKLSAGGRHSGAITYCGKILAWGWGEEGQLGHGSEQNSNLPRPSKIPRLGGKIGVPVEISCGMSHTVVVLRNPEYVAPPPLPAVVEDPVEEDEVTEEPSFVVELVVVPPPAPMEPPAAVAKPAVIMEEDEEPLSEEPVLRGIRGLLQQRDEKPPTPIEEPPVVPEAEEEANNEEVEEEDDGYVPDFTFISNENYDFSAAAEEQQQVIVDSGIAEEEEQENVEEGPAPEPVSEAGGAMAGAGQQQQAEKVEYFFNKEGQDLQRCRVANTAMRAEMRKKKKAATSG